MKHDYDIDFLIEHRPDPLAPTQVTTDQARAALLAHGARRRRRRRSAVAAVGALAVVGAAVAITSVGPGPAAGGRSHITLAIVTARTPKRTPTRTKTVPLVRLAADVRVQPSAPQPGDATLVVRDTVYDGSHVYDGAVYGGYDLYTDSGHYYYAPDSLAQLQQQVDSHQTVFDSGNEAKALDTIATAAGGTPDQARIATLSTFPHGLAPMPTPAQAKASLRQMERLTKRHFKYVPPTRASWILSQDSDLWIAATQALAVGAGRSDVRAAAIKALSTLTGVTQTQTRVNGTRALMVGFPDGGTPEIIWLNATTGVPIQEKDGSDSATRFEVERVTAARLPSHISPAARLR
jgi:hypothetical protein